MEHQQRLVLHLDADAFFVQVEQLRDPGLRGKAIAIQQHQDIIAANAAAKAAGVYKHCSPAEARRALQRVGGRVVHVHLAAGGRVSYQPYRTASKALMRLLASFPWASVVETASIDEAYVAVDPGAVAAAAGAGVGEGAAAASHGSPAAGQQGATCPGLSAAAAALGRRCAEEVRAAAAAQLGLVVSAGAAPNKMLAKLASAASKPDGVLAVEGAGGVDGLLARTAASRLPGCGGRLAEALQQHGIQAASDLRRFSPPQLQTMLGVKPAQAEQLLGWAWGHDPSAVQERGPPKNLSVQMSLTPQALPMHPSHAGEAPAGGGPPGVLLPLVVGAADFAPRVHQLMGAMGADLLERVREDRQEERRWPRTLSATLRTAGSNRSAAGATATRSGAFPHWALAEQRAGAQQQRQQGAQKPGLHQHAGAQQARQQHAQQHALQQQQPPQLPQPQEDPLLPHLVRSLEALVRQAAAGHPAATVVELRLAATAFDGLAAQAAAPIARFLRPAVAPAAAGAASSAAQPREAGPPRPPAAVEQQVPAAADQRQQPAAAVAAAAQMSRGREEAELVELAAIDVAEQRRILKQIAAASASPAAGTGPEQALGGAAAGSAAGSKRHAPQRSRSTAAARDTKQPRIAQFFKPRGQ